MIAKQLFLFSAVAGVKLPTVATFSRSVPRSLQIRLTDNGRETKTKTDLVPDTGVRITDDVRTNTKVEDVKSEKPVVTPVVVSDEEKTKSEILAEEKEKATEDETVDENSRSKENGNALTKADLVKATTKEKTEPGVKADEVRNNGFLSKDTPVTVTLPQLASDVKQSNPSSTVSTQDKAAVGTVSDTETQPEKESSEEKEVREEPSTDETVKEETAETEKEKAEKEKREKFVGAGRFHLKDLAPSEAAQMSLDNKGLVESMEKSMIKYLCKTQEKGREQCEAQTKVQITKMAVVEDDTNKGRRQLEEENADSAEEEDSAVTKKAVEILFEILFEKYTAEQAASGSDQMDEDVMKQIVQQRADEILGDQAGDSTTAVDQANSDSAESLQELPPAFLEDLSRDLQESDSVSPDLAEKITAPETINVQRVPMSVPDQSSAVGQQTGSATSQTEKEPQPELKIQVTTSEADEAGLPNWVYILGASMGLSAMSAFAACLRRRREKGEEEPLSPNASGQKSSWNRSGSRRRLPERGSKGGYVFGGGGGGVKALGKHFTKKMDGAQEIDECCVEYALGTIKLGGLGGKSKKPSVVARKTDNATQFGKSDGQSGKSDTAGDSIADTTASDAVPLSPSDASTNTAALPRSNSFFEELVEETAIVKKEVAEKEVVSQEIVPAEKTWPEEDVVTEEEVVKKPRKTKKKKKKAPRMSEEPSFHMTEW